MLYSTTELYHRKIAVGGAEMAALEPSRREFPEMVRFDVGKPDGCGGTSVLLCKRDLKIGPQQCHVISPKTQSKHTRIILHIYSVIYSLQQIRRCNCCLSLRPRAPCGRTGPAHHHGRITAPSSARAASSISQLGAALPKLTPSASPRPRYSSNRRS